MQVNLLQDSPRKLFFQYLIPSVSATMVTSIYLLADSIMIGKGLGEIAIAALNLVLPLFNILFGTGALFGVGGGVLFSVAMGNRDGERARRYFTLAVLLNAAFMFVYLICGLLLLAPILRILGATAVTMPDALAYARVISFGVPFFSFSFFLQAFIRNDQAPRLAMAAVISGGVANIILDWIFIFPLGLGMSGAAAATVLGTALTCAILCSHFFHQENRLRLLPQKLRPRYVKEIFQYGFSSFFMEISNGIVIFVFNLQLLHYAGELGVTVYSILSNSAYIIIALSNGIAQAAQPIIATNFGAKLMERIQQVKSCGLRTAAIEGSFFALLGLLFPLAVVYIFINPTEEILRMAPLAVRLYFLSFIGMALNIFYTNYFQATLQPSKALTVCALRGLVLCVTLAYLLPIKLGVTGIWMAMPLAETITLLVAMILARSPEKKK